MFLTYLSVEAKAKYMILLKYFLEYFRLIEIIHIASFGVGDLNHTNEVNVLNKEKWLKQNGFKINIFDIQNASIIIFFLKFFLS